MELEIIILSEVSQVQKIKGHMFSLICGIKTKYNHNQYYETTGKPNSTMYQDHTPSSSRFHLRDAGMVQHMQIIKHNTAY
jgi:hypothetical protein